VSGAAIADASREDTPENLGRRTRASMVGVHGHAAVGGGRRMALCRAIVVAVILGEGGTTSGATATNVPLEVARFLGEEFLVRGEGSIVASPECLLGQVCDRRLLVTMTPTDWPGGTSWRWQTNATVWLPNRLRRGQLLSWLLHFAGSVAKLRPNTKSDLGYELVIMPVERGQEGDSYFDCYREERGDWHRAIGTNLRAPWSAPSGRWMSVKRFLEYAVAQRGMPLVVEPTAFLRSRRRGLWGVDPIVRLGQNWSTVGEALTNALGQVGLNCRLQGGLIYVHDGSDIPASP
jgi:hypothetical protein